MWRSLVPVAALAFASGCANVVSIDAEDRTRFAHFEVSAPLGNQDPWRLQLRASSSDGKFEQSLESFERIEIDNASVFGPATVAGEIDLVYYSIAVGAADASQPRAGELHGAYYVGVAVTEFDLELDDGVTRYTDRDGTTELYLQFSFDYGIGDSLEFGLAWAGSIGPDLSGISELDLELGWRLAGPLRVAGGYRWLEYIYAEKDDESHIEVDFRGPYLALGLAFD